MENNGFRKVDENRYDCKWCLTCFFLKEEDVERIMINHHECQCSSAQMTPVPEPVFLKQDDPVYRCPNCGQPSHRVDYCCETCGFFDGYVNLTPHPVVLYDADTTKILARWPSEIIPARLKETSTQEGNIRKIFYTGVENLPEPKEGVIYIVSLPLLMAMPGRGDLVAPDTGEGAVRDETGRILGTKGWVQLKDSST